MAPCSIGVSHSHARTKASARWYCLSPDGPCSDQACPRWRSSARVWLAIQALCRGGILAHGSRPRDWSLSDDVLPNVGGRLIRVNLQKASGFCAIRLA